MKCNATIKLIAIGLYFDVSLVLLFGTPADNSITAHVVYYGFVLGNFYNASRLLKALAKNSTDNGNTAAANGNGISERSD